MLSALSLENAPSESEFLLRELGIEWTTITHSELEASLGSGPPTLLAVSEAAPYETLIRDCAPDSLILIMTSDEAYSPERLQLASHSAVRRVYRHYSPSPASNIQVLRAMTGYVRDAGSTDQKRRTVIPNMASGRAVRARMRAWDKIQARVRSLPLGYTDTFARAFAQYFDCPAEVSLFGLPLDHSPRTISVGFRGNRGLAQRIVGCARAQRLPAARIELVDADWSARAAHDNGGDYVDLLLKSRFALCPPGFANNESFRYYESLLCGALPIEVEIATTHLGVTPWHEESVKASSWTSALRSAIKMPEPERQMRAANAKARMARNLQALSLLIHADAREVKRRM